MPHAHSNAAAEDIQNRTKADSRLAEYLRVNHAGERAAQTIYKGQLAVLGNHPDAAEIQHMMEQEQEHLDAFDHLLNEYQVRPSLLDPVWGAAGFILGAATAAMGPKAAMACTIAVEEVIGTHYDNQVKDLSAKEKEPELEEVLAKFRDDELEHRDIAVAHDGREAPAYNLMQKIISTGCKTAIKIAEKI
ncbi:MAG: demethoxyubiquinone hydroxylase family protein [Alphaproteobacteria bacterium]|nr:demethoxyubiquinone hydroxylase family protein [Alphaproteobacteria bacterium]MBL6775955.1 demethoxyubiquinone hydroxylase family protein [Alphaproteobacteria bacterium]